MIDDAGYMPAFFISIFFAPGLLLKGVFNCKIDTKLRKRLRICRDVTTNT